MYYIFDRTGKCVGTCSATPNMDDLATREERAVETVKNYKITDIQLMGDKIQEIPLDELPTSMTEKSPYVDDARLAAFEAMAAQEARLVAQGERLTALEAELSALKGGEGK